MNSNDPVALKPQSDCNDCEKVQAFEPKPKKEIPMRLKSFTVVINEKEYDITMKDIYASYEGNNEPWVIRRIFNDEDLLRAILLKVTK